MSLLFEILNSRGYAAREVVVLHTYFREREHMWAITEQLLPCFRYVVAWFSHLLKGDADSHTAP